MSPLSILQSREIAEFLRETTSNPDITEVKHVNMPGNQPPWQATGLMLGRGQAYSLFAGGRIRWSDRYPHLYGEPSFHLWARINPGGRAVNLTSNSDTFFADCEGELELGIYMGMWADEYGNLKSPIFTVFRQMISATKLMGFPNILV